MTSKELLFLKKKLIEFVLSFNTDNETPGEITGEFALIQGNTKHDLYGMLDAVYNLYILGVMDEYTSSNSRKMWAAKILDCQDNQGWFSKKNLRGHSKEHATAYAIGALILLEQPGDDHYLENVKPLNGIKSIFSSEKNFKKWINRLGFKITTDDPVGHAGWNYIWRSSHLGGGIAAALGMTRELHKNWWPEKDTEEWFNWYFSWLDKKANKKTGYWQRAIWNWFVPGPTLIDMAGAVHFYWVYEKYGHPLPYPDRIIDSTLKVQKETGLYRSFPMCIDLDGNFCLTRSINALGRHEKDDKFMLVNESLSRNFEAVKNYLQSHSLNEVYNDSHGLPGALAALAECQVFEGFELMEEAKEFRNPFDKAWWI